MFDNDIILLPQNSYYAIYLQNQWTHNFDMTELRFGALILTTGSVTSATLKCHLLEGIGSQSVVVSNFQDLFRGVGQQPP